MCGICGFYHTNDSIPSREVAKKALSDMLKQLRHRGPDGSGFHTEPGVGLGHSRLSIVGLGNGKQPIANEDQSIWLTLNGEIFNHKELRKDLISRGHTFSTDSDSEVVLHLYEDEGMDFLNKINGQFAFAIWDRKKRDLILCRDHFGIAPLFFTNVNDSWVFGSELKSILAFPGIEPKIDFQALDQIFTFWSVLAPRTPLQNIQQVKPGCYVKIQNTSVTETRYWDMSFQNRNATPSFSTDDAISELGHLLTKSINVRRQADIPVGAYLSGGLDSSAITVIASKLMGHPPEAFSIRFSDSEYDEGDHQSLLTKFSGIESSSITFTANDLVSHLPQAVYHAETPVLRTGMVPMMLLSGHTRASNFKAVMGGEGADEFLVGYNIFKESKVRRFWAKQPSSAARANLLRKLYPYLPLDAGAASFWQNFFSQNMEVTEDPLYSHRLRWASAARTKRFFSKSLQRELEGYDPCSELVSYLPKEFHNWEPMGKAQYIEATLFLSNYLLSSQGDRMAMANAVEVRYPFLDIAFVEFCNSLPAKWKMRGLNEKMLLKKAMARQLPSEITKRSKQPYRAPSVSFSEQDILWDVLNEKSLDDSGIFDPQMVGLLLTKLKKHNQMWSEADQMALTGILTTQLFYSQFIK
ncbi:asparagine synthase (glutamine-hydrolyzing) [bacterium]|nr:asparagine synthase (glutamine-hydrolyzing) [bacterium]